jgi:transposase
MDLRSRIMAACAEGATDTAVAQRFGVCTKTVQRYRQRAAQGELEPRRPPGAVSQIRPEQEAEFIAMVTAHPHFTLEQFCQQWQERTGVVLPRSTLHYHLQRLGGRYKKRV